MERERIDLANRALHTAGRGSMAQIDNLEDEQGASLSSILDELWYEATFAGQRALARRLEKAFDDLTAQAPE